MYLMIKKIIEINKTRLKSNSVLDRESNIFFLKHIFKTSKVVKTCQKTFDTLSRLLRPFQDFENLFQTFQNFSRLLD